VLMAPARIAGYTAVCAMTLRPGRRFELDAA
jgi:hypothetical protein